MYGATPGGVCAAVAACRQGRQVVVVEPGRRAGGILSSGILPGQDAPHEAAIGGLSQWVLDNINGTSAERETAFGEMLADAGARVIFKRRLQTVEKRKGTIQAAVFEWAPPESSGAPALKADGSEPDLRIEAQAFIDATYEGDLMAMAEVDFATGRESVEQYGESLAGVQAVRAIIPISPFRSEHDPASGLLPHVEESHGLPPESGDEYTQAYNFRFYVTDNERYRVPLNPPGDYNPEEFELLGRYVAYLVDQGKADELWKIFPGRKGDGQCNYQRSALFSIAPLGLSRRYQNGGYADRACLWRDHFKYLRGLKHFMATDPRVPESVRHRNARIGLDRRQHPDNDGWPDQLYIRAARRMRGAYILTQADIEHRTTIADPIGYAGYGIDVYPVRRIVVRNGSGMALGVATEGEMFVGGSKGTGPYPVPYRMITPRIEQCDNLLVPVCYAASFVAFASSRMEPVFMITGECAGIAASLAIERGLAVQQISYERLRARLVATNQIVPEPGDPSKMAVMGVPDCSNSSGGSQAAAREKTKRLSTGIAIDDERLKPAPYNPAGLRKD